MGVGPADFRVEIIKARPQTAVSPTLGAPPIGDVLDVTNRILRDGLGSINRAMERDLLSFKTGDVTLSLQNRDGFFDDLFAFFGPTDMWGLRIYRRGDVQFYGVLVAVGSITFDRKVKTLSLTAYGLTKLLDMTDASTVKRTIAPMTVTAATAGASTITLNSTSGLLSGDTLHVTDNINKEDLTVKQVTSATVCSLEAVIVSGYAAGSAVTCPTPYYRFKSISSLITLLFTEAGIGLAELRISLSQFKRLAPAPVNLSGLAAFSGSTPTLGSQAYTTPMQRSGRRYEALGGDGSYYQSSPDADWVKEDATQSPWVDWSRYFVESSPEPSIHLRSPNLNESLTHRPPHQNGWDFVSGTKIMYYIDEANRRLLQRTSADGIVWGGATVVSNAGLIGGMSNGTAGDIGAELDQARGIIYGWSTSNSGGALFSGAWSISGAAWTDLRQAGDAATTGYAAFTFVPELDCVIALRATVPNGPAFQIVAFRGTSFLWARSFPNCAVQDYSGGPPGFYYNWPTHSIRYVGGTLYCIVISDGKTQLVWSDDQFLTYRMKALTDPGSGPRAFAARVNGAYQITCLEGSLQRGRFIAAPFYAGVIKYADFDGLSVAEALKKLSILTNSLFWVDDDAQGHFVARDLYDAGSVFDGSRIMTDQTDSILWDQSAQYAAVSGNGVNTTSGTPAFAAQGIELESSFIPNEAFCQALSDSYFAFFSPQRKFVQGGAHDIDGHIFRPLDRLTLGGPERYLVYESDHSMPDDSIALQLLEDK